MKSVKILLIGLVRGYQIVISPLFPPSCRFQPTCSHYAIEALDRHGPIKGSWLAVSRVCRCNPFVPGGYDPVPPRDRSGSVEDQAVDDQAVEPKL